MNIPLRLQNARYLNFKNAAICSHLSGRKWPQGFAGASGLKWPQVAASGRKWPQVAAGRNGSLEQVHGSQLQPLSATRVVSSGRKWPQVAASAASGRKWRKWPQVAASGRKWPLAARGFKSKCMAATCSHSSGRK